MWPLHAVLVDKYQFPATEAQEISEFLLPMLHVDIRKRATASDCLRSKWLFPYNIIETSEQNNNQGNPIGCEQDEIEKRMTNPVEPHK